ncbi:hypothetical protein LY78DRAFT_740993 [Colletotrichum sublineola]|nr:hypothetical protein LY78DRAFT_740993 [Colletotrichum sublineola]
MGGLTCELKNMASKGGGVDKSKAARELYRFRSGVLEHDPGSKKLQLLNEVDPGYKYLESLGWDKVPDEETEEGWQASWDKGQEGVGVNGILKGWRSIYSADCYEIRSYPALPVPLFIASSVFVFGLVHWQYGPPAKVT